jgi:hypothetical protein
VRIRNELPSEDVELKKMKKKGSLIWHLVMDLVKGEGSGRKKYVYQSGTHGLNVSRRWNCVFLKCQEKAGQLQK